MLLARLWSAAAYIISGVMLIYAASMAFDVHYRTMRGFFRTYKRQVRFGDQDAINGVLARTPSLLSLLPESWNVQIGALYHKLCALKTIDQTGIKRSLDNGVIYHYVARRNRGNRNGDCQRAVSGSIMQLSVVGCHGQKC